VLFEAADSCEVLPNILSRLGPPTELPDFMGHLHDWALGLLLKPRKAVAATPPVLLQNVRLPQGLYMPNCPCYVAIMCDERVMHLLIMRFNVFNG
jgi:hypothetical protein